MKKYRTILLSSALILGVISLVLPAAQVFGGGDGSVTSQSSGAGMTSMVGLSGSNNGYYDSNGNGRPDYGEPANGSGGGSSNGSSGGGGTPTLAPPPPLPCTLTLSKSVIELGTSTTLLSWTPTPKGKVNLRRDTKKLTVPDNATTYSDIVAPNKPGKYTYTVSYAVPSSKVAVETPTDSTIASQAAAQSAAILLACSGTYGGNCDSGGPNGSQGSSNQNNGGAPQSSKTNQYSCTATLRVVSKITECNDGKNNDSEDTLIDQQDPACHTDGNPGNPMTYNPNGGSEKNVPADIIPSVSVVTKANLRKPIQVTASATNKGGAYATANALVYGWRDTSGTTAPSCGRRGRQCFTENGHTFSRLNTFSQTYKINQTRTDFVRSFNPPVKGKYEVCAIADFTNVIAEGTAGEANNHTCRIIDVLDPAVVIPPTIITGPLSLTATPTRIRKDTPATLTWDTGGRTECTITGTNGDTISLVGAASASSKATPAITSLTTYTLSCIDDDSSIDATIRLLPQYREI